MKRQKLSETTSKPTHRSCTQAKQIEFGLDSPALDVVISDKFLKVLCQCDDCAKAFLKVKKMIHEMENLDGDTILLVNNLEGEVNHEESEELAVQSEECTGELTAGAGNFLLSFYQHSRST